MDLRVIRVSLKNRQIRHNWNFLIALPRQPALTSLVSFSLVFDPEHVESVPPGHRSSLLRTRFVQIFDFIAPHRSASLLRSENWLTPFLPWFPGYDESHPSGSSESDDVALFHFKAAHGLLICGNRSLADRRITEAIAVLSSSRNVSPATLTYGWLVIASDAASKGDFEAVRIWTRQAVRTFQSLPDSVQRKHLQRLSGDLLALQSDAAIAGQRPQEGLQLLTDAQNCHQADGSNECQALDLLLRSRCFASMGLWEEAASDLHHAEGLLNHSSEDDVSGRLRVAIQSDLGRLLLRRTSQARVALN
jgi:hypothetical protein